MGETDPALVDAVLGLASDDPDLPDEAKYLVLAALDGDTALAEALDGRYAATRGQDAEPEPGPEPIGAYLRAITVAGFRGIGPESTLRLRPGPGLTIVAGRNGSGKSSFAEALEVALTGDSSRRAMSASEWAANWTNLHSGRPRMIRLELTEDDVGTTTVGVDWPTDGTAFTDRRTWVQRPGQPRENDIAVLGWTRALQDCSPLLPHEELGRLLTAPPNELYNKLESILGLGRFADAQDRLNAAHKAAAEPEKQMRAELTALKKALAASDDERAAAAHSHLSRRPPRRDVLRGLATGSDHTGGVTAGLVALAKLPAPDRAVVAAAVEALQTAVAAVPEGADEALDLAARRSRLLREALELHGAHGDRPCPVCGAAWLHLAEQADAASEPAERVAAARAWLMRNVETLRNRQLAPLAAETAAIWEVLRQESNVDITDIRLPNPTRNNQRRVEIAATVDGVDAGAFSVMSTGELHAITLALFLPRATRPESPFRFVVLDDPVQAMDPSKIDGLVRVLADVAATRQLVVFSHDDRLTEAARRLMPDARTVQVRRAARSIVTVDACHDPAARDLDDARSLLSDPNVPDDVRRIVLPQLCRRAFEAAARDAFYSRAFAAGRSRETVEEEWGRVRKGPTRLALALHADQQADVSPWIRRQPWRKRALDVCGRGSHDGLDGDLWGAVEDVRRLVGEIRSAR